MSKEYLGDWVYVEFDDHGLTLTTDSGFGPSNMIYLESAVWAQLLSEYVARVKGRREREGGLAKRPSP
jgi:hypothetical protein